MSIGSTVCECLCFDAARARASSSRNAQHPLSSPPTSIHRLLRSSGCEGAALTGKEEEPNQKCPFNTWENNPDETWILCISLSSTISSSSPPWAPSPLLLTGDSVSKLTGDYFLRDEQSSVRALWSYPQSHFGERPGGQTVSVVVCVNIVSANCHEPAGWFTAASPERRKNKHGDPAIHFQRNNPLSVCQSSQEHHRKSARATHHDTVKRTQLNELFYTVKTGLNLPVLKSLWQQWNYWIIWRMHKPETPAKYAS